MEALIYLDTHIVVWLYERQLGLLTTRAKRLLDAEDLLVSPMVVLELDYLRESNRITLPSHKIVEYLRRKVGLSICDKSFQEVITSACKQSWTRDPFDRVIVGHASLDQNRLLTKDEHILKHYRHAVW